MTAIVSSPTGRPVPLAPISYDLERCLREKVGDAVSEIVIYGFSHCCYGMLFTLLKGTSFKPLNYDNYFPLNPLATELPSSYTATKSHIRLYKAILVSVMVENYRREKKGLPIVPVIFCIDTDEKIHRPSDLLRKTRCATISELKVAQAFCTDPLFSEEMQRVAQKTFLFVKFTFKSYTYGKLTFIPAPWILNPTAWVKLPKVEVVETPAARWHCWGLCTRNVVHPTPPPKFSWKKWVIETLEKP